MEFFIVLALFGLFIWVYQIQQRIKKLEQGSPALADTPISPQLETPAPMPVDDGVDRSKWPKHLQTAVATIDGPKTPKIEIPKTPPFELESFLGQKLFPILGATSIVLAIGFFTVLAFANGWIGPIGQISVGIAVSLVLLGLGEYLRPKFPDFFSYVSSAGLAGLIICTLVARHHYDLIQAVPALGFLAFQTAIGVYLTLRYSSRVLGNFSIITGLMAPWLSGQIDMVVMLPYVVIITLGGFVLASRKQWPELFAALILFDTSYILYAIGQLHSQYGRELVPEINDVVVTTGNMNPFVLLGLIVALYGLIASAGVVRLLTQKQTDEPNEQAYEIGLFTLALILANLCMASVYKIMEWEHVGVVILFEALILYGLAEIFAKRHWYRFHAFALAGSLLFVLIATLYEFRDFDPALLFLVVLAEGVIFCTLGQLTKSTLYEWFGRLAIFIGLGLFIDEVENTEPWWLLTLYVILLICAWLYSVGRPQRIMEKIWFGTALFVVSNLIFQWSDNQMQLSGAWVHLATAIWGGLLVAGYQKFKSSFLLWASGLNLLLAVMLSLDLHPSDNWQIALNGLWIGLWGAGIFALLDSQQTQKIIRIGALVLTIFTFLYTTAEVLTEPLLTIAWLAGAGVLLALGLYNQQRTEIRYGGLAIILLVISKLYLVTIWDWAIEIRVVAFAALGVSLLLLGFFYQKLWLKK